MTVPAATTGHPVAHSNRRRRRAPSPAKRRKTLDTAWQLSTGELLGRCSSVPSRAHMQRPQIRADLAENLARTYEAIWRRARYSQNAVIDTTWAQLQIAAGYPPDTNLRGVLLRYLELLAEAGLLMFGGTKDESGAWRRLDIELHEPPVASEIRRSSSVGVPTSWRCVARRMRESRFQRRARRVRPYRRQGGRGRMVPRSSLSWSSKVCGPPTEREPPLRGGLSSMQSRTRAGGRVTVGPRSTAAGGPLAVTGSVARLDRPPANRACRRLERRDWRTFAGGAEPRALVDQRLEPLVEQLPTLDVLGDPAVTLDLAAVVLGELQGRPVVLQGRAGRRLPGALRRAERYGPVPGSGLAALVDLALTQRAATDRPVPLDAGLLAADLDRLSRRRRRRVRAARRAAHENDGPR